MDTDYADYWILEKILLAEYRPKLIVIETNEQKECVTVEKPSNLTYWDGRTMYTGASLCAYQCLAKRFDYTIVYCESAGVNCFWMRNDILRKIFQIKIAIFKRVLTNSFLRPWKSNRATNKSSQNKWHHIFC